MPTYYPIGAAAKRLGVHAQTLLRWVRAGQVPAVSVDSGGRWFWLFTADDLAVAEAVRDANRAHVATQRHLPNYLRHSRQAEAAALLAQHNGRLACPPRPPEDVP